jgi:cephalosporin hydroxylase
VTETLDPYIEYTLSHLPGWCSPEKRAATAKIIEELNPSLIVEIGTYGGSWLLPASLAAKSARCVGIDPYSAGACVEGMTTEANIKWWGDEKMLEGIYAGLLASIARLKAGNVEIMRSASEDVVERFADGSIDLFHSDANHSAEPTMRNVQLYLPKLRVGGVFVQDDLGWVESGVRTVQPAVDWLMENGCEWMFEVSGAAFMRKVK